MGQKTLSEILGNFVHELYFKDLPPEVVEKAEISVGDGLACAFAGRDLPSSRITLDLWKEIKREGNSTLWVNATKGDFESTAWANCQLMHSMLQDDMQASTRGHMGSLIIPTAYAIAEQEGRGGAEFLNAVVAAYEVAGRIGERAGKIIVSRGFRGSPVFGTFAAATAAGKLFRLSREQLQNAIACAANFSCGILEASNQGSMEWRFQNGVALKNGILAARLAKKGLQCTPTSLEGDQGFFHSFGGPELRSDILRQMDQIIASLGQDFEITKNIFKPYTTCGANQVGVEVIRKLAEKHDIRLKDVERINIFVRPDNKKYPGGDYHGPFATFDQALLSKPFSLGAALKYKDLTLKTYLQQLNDPDILEIAKKVVTEGKEGMGFLDIQMEIILKNGQVFVGDQNLADAGNYSLDKTRAVEKFCRLTFPHLQRDKAALLINAVFDLPNILNLSDFSEILKNAITP